MPGWRRLPVVDRTRLCRRTRAGTLLLGDGH